MKINSKILFFVLSTSFLIFAISIGYVSTTSRSKGIRDARTIADAYAREYANEVEANLNIDAGITRTLAQAFEGYTNIPLQVRTPIYEDIAKNIFAKNDQYIAVWVSWELNAIDTAFTQTHGRKITQVHRENGSLHLSYIIRDLESPNVNSIYYTIKTNPKETVTAPYFYSYNEEDSILETSVVTPIMNGKEFVGLAGVDVSLERYKALIAKIRPFEESFAFLVANDGTFVAHPRDDFKGTKITEQYPRFMEEHDILNKIQAGLHYSFTIENENNNDNSYVSLAPIFIGNAEDPWAIGIVSPMSVITAEGTRTFYITIAVGIVGIILLAIVIYFISKNISEPLVQTTAILKNIERGVIDRTHKLRINTRDEIGQMARSVNTLVETLDKTVNFASQIGKGNLNASYEKLSNEDVLGQSLLEMRKNLRQAQTDEKARKQEDDRRNWASQGLARFSRILREDHKNMETLFYNIISNLVKYTDSGAGGAFLVNNETPADEHIELVASFAFDKRKKHQKRVELKEGYLGACYQEKKTIHLDKLPDNYLKINTGLGSSAPKNLLIVPIVDNNQVLGMLELASFHIIESYQIKFAENLAESIGITIASIKSGIQTAQLLKQAKENSRLMSEKEQTLQQTITEMKKVQTEAQIREAEMRSLINAINSSSLVAEYNMEGEIIAINDLFLNLLGLTREQIIGKKHGEFDARTETPEKNNELWEELRKGNIQKIVQHVEVRDKKILLSETYTPITDSKGQPLKVLNIAFEINE